MSGTFLFVSASLCCVVLCCTDGTFCGWDGNQEDGKEGERANKRVGDSIDCSPKYLFRFRGGTWEERERENASYERSACFFTHLRDQSNEAIHRDTCVTTHTQQKTRAP